MGCAARVLSEVGSTILARDVAATDHRAGSDGDQLARHIMAERGLNTADTALLQLFTRRTGALLRWQKKRGILRSVKDPQHGRFDLWEIAI
jgi:hypothetical protein